MLSLLRLNEDIFMSVEFDISCEYIVLLWENAENFRLLSSLQTRNSSKSEYILSLHLFLLILILQKYKYVVHILSKPNFEWNKVTLVKYDINDSNGHVTISGKPHDLTTFYINICQSLGKRLGIVIANYSWTSRKTFHPSATAFAFHYRLDQGFTYLTSLLKLGLLSVVIKLVQKGIKLHKLRGGKPKFLSVQRLFIRKLRAST